MSVTVTSTTAQRHATEVTREDAVRRLDATLFTMPAFTIDAANRHVAGHVSIDAARAAVTAGHGATWVATVRPGVVAVDVDLADDDVAAAVLGPLIEWCDEHSVWSCARRSGGGVGRWHLFAVTAELSEAFTAVVQELRTHHGHDARQVDLRTAIRPLSAPHRLSGAIDLPEDIQLSAAALVDAPRQPFTGPAPKRRPQRKAPARPALTQALVPLSPQFWREITQPHPVGVDRSAIEFAHTIAMVRAGLSESQAWAIIANPANVGLARARERGRAWWRKYGWNDVEILPTPRAPRVGVGRTLWEGSYDWGRLVVPAVLGLRRVWGRWGVRERHTVEHVLACVADRFARSGVEVLPLALRSLVEDTGLALATVRRALGELVGAGFLVREEVEEGEVSRDGCRAHVYRLVVEALVFDVVVDTPMGYTPPPCDPLWVGSPAGSLSAWLSLHLAGPAPTRHQLSVCLPWLVGRGLVTASGQVPAVPPARRVARPRAGLRRWRQSRAAHRRERQAFREQVAAARSLARERWAEGRRRALAREAALNCRRRAAWWAGLGPDERRVRLAGLRGQGGGQGRSVEGRGGGVGCDRVGVRLAIGGRSRPPIADCFETRGSSG